MIPSLFTSTQLNPNLTRRQWLGLTGAAVAGALAAPSRAEAVGPPEAAQTVGSYRFKLGDVEIIQLSDGSVPFQPLHPMFNSKGTAEEVTNSLSELKLSTDFALFHFTPVLIRTKGTTILVDTGCGPGMEGAGRLTQHLAYAKVDPTTINVVLVSHAHFDHTGGLMDSAARILYPNAEIRMHKAEADYWTSAAPDFSKSSLPADQQKQMAEGSKKFVEGVGKKLKPIGKDETLAEGVKVLHTPGHTPGHLSLEITSGGKQLIIASDVWHHSYLSLRHPEWHFMYDSDGALAVETRKKMLDRLAKENVFVSSYHMPFPSVGKIVKDGAGYLWVPTVWNWDPNAQIS